MFRKLQADGQLWQDEAVYEIETRFGESFIYINPNGNPAINRRVLKEFQRLTHTTVVWERGERMWRFREPTDPSGQRQADY